MSYYIKKGEFIMKMCKKSDSLLNVAAGIGFPEFPNGKRDYIIKFKNDKIAKKVLENKEIKKLVGGNNYAEVSSNLLDYLALSNITEEFINICSRLKLSVTIISGHGHGDTGHMFVESNQEKAAKYEWENSKELDNLNIPDYTNVDIYCDFFV